MPSFMDRIPRPQAINTEMERLMREHFSGGGSSYSGVAVNSESAMRMMTVNNCVKVLFNCVSQMPCQLMEDVNDVKNKAKNHYLYKIISKRPNRWMTAPQLWGMAIVHVSLRGNFIAFKTGRPGSYKEILPVHPDRLQEIRQNPDWSLTYKITNAVGGGYQEYTQDQIFHIRGLSLDGFTGMNPIQYARECIGLGIASERFLANYFGKGLHPGAIIERPEKMDLTNQKNMLEAYKIAYSGLGKSSDLMLLDNGSKIEFPPIKLVDAQFIEQMRLTESQICGMYGVPLILVQAGANPATYASSTEFKRNFVDMTLAPIAVNFETSVDRDFLTDVEQDTYYTKFNLNSLLRGNMTERFASYAVGIANTFMSPNEARALEDWNKREGGDVYKNPNTSSSKDSDKVKTDDNTGSDDEDLQ